MSATDHDLGAQSATDDDRDLRFDADDDGQDDLFTDDDPPTVSLEPREGPFSSWSLRWVLGVFAVLVVAGLTAGIMVFNSSAPSDPRGRVTPQDTTRAFLTALNAGNEKQAARLSCDSFGSAARSAARSGADPGIAFTLVRVAGRHGDTATAQLAQRMKVGGSVQTTLLRLVLHRNDGRWLVCARR